MEERAWRGQSRLSHRIRKLVERGHVQVMPCGTDGRVSIARITDAGRRVLDELRPAHLHDVRRLLFEHLGPDQVAALADALDAVVTCLAAYPGSIRSAEIH